MHYFQVWSELKGYWNAQAGQWDAAGYTQPTTTCTWRSRQSTPPFKWAVHTSFWPTAPKPGAAGLSGPWGSVDSRALAVLIYWLTHAVGADFVAVDADSEPSEGPAPVDPFRALGKFAAVDDWLTARTSLPIWWSEFYVQPGSTSWTTQHQDAVLTAALGLMDRSGASVALLWGPEQDGQGGQLGYLWTSCAQTGGGRPTPLAASLEALNRLHQSPSGGSIEVNESDRPAAWAGRRLAPYQVVYAKQ